MPAAKKPAPAAITEMEQVQVARVEPETNAQNVVHQGRACVTPAEYAILQSIHGDGSIRILAVGESKEYDSVAEKVRLSRIYDRNSNLDRMTRQTPTQRLFPGAGMLPATFADIGVKLPKTRVGESTEDAAEGNEAKIARLKAQLAALEDAEASKKIVAKNAAQAKKDADADDLMG